MCSILHSLGWDSQNSRPPTGGVYLHHPAGDVMKFSIGYDNPRLVGQYWFQRLSLGGLEPGSSGAPVMEGADQNRLIFGPVSGGDLDNGGCGRDVEARVGSFFGAWTGGGTAATRLSNWLSPGNASRRELVTLSIRPAMPSVSGGRGALPHLVLVEAKNSYNSRQYDWEMVAPNNSVTRQTTSSNKTYFTLYDMPSGTYKFRSRGRNGAGTGNWSNYYYTGYTAYPSLSVKDRPAANSLIAVYPNPSANRIMVDGTTMKDNSVLEDDLNLSFIELFDEAGELVFRSDINDDKIEIITELYKAGTYIMHVHHDKGVVKERVLIER